MKPTNITMVRFHQPIRIGGKMENAVSLDQALHAKKFKLSFSQGFVVIEEKGVSGAVFVGLANVAYIHADIEGRIVNTGLEEQITSNDSLTLNLSDVNAKEAMKIVKQTKDKKVLSDWLSKETRVSVLDAIKAQIK